MKRFNEIKGSYIFTSFIILIFYILIYKSIEKVEFVNLDGFIDVLSVLILSVVLYNFNLEYWPVIWISIFFVKMDYINSVNAYQVNLEFVDKLVLISTFTIVMVLEVMVLVIFLKKKNIMETIFEDAKKILEFLLACFLMSFVASALMATSIYIADIYEVSTEELMLMLVLRNMSSLVIGLPLAISIKMKKSETNSKIDKVEMAYSVMANILITTIYLIAIYYKIHGIGLGIILVIGMWMAMHLKKMILYLNSIMIWVIVMLITHYNVINYNMDKYAPVKINIFMIILSIEFLVVINICNRKIKKEILAKDIEQKFKSIFNIGITGIAITSTKNTWINVNDKFLNLMGYSRDELNKKNWSDLIYSDDKKQSIMKFREMKLGELKEYEMEKRYVKKDGTILYSTTSVKAVKNERSEIIYFITVIKDITELKRTQLELKKFASELEIRVMERTLELKELNENMKKEIEIRNEIQERLMKSEFKLREIQRLAHLGGWEYDVERDELIWSEETFRIMNIEYDRGEPSFEGFKELILPEERLEFERKIEKLIKFGGAFEMEIKHLDRKKSKLYSVIKARASKSLEGKMKIIGSIYDITKIKVAEEKMREYATMDEMTGLMNRRTGLLFLEKEFEKSRRRNKDLTICFIDANGLKEVNDTYGHNEGDWLIKTISKLIIQSIREEDVSCRLGGDEFLIIFTNCNEEKARNIWGRILSKVENINKTNEKPYKISLSHGFADYKKLKPISADEFLNIADTKMYEEKQKIKRKNFSIIKE